MGRLWGIALVPAVAFALVACNIEREQRGELPDVDVDGGQLPEYQVEPGDVDMGRDTVAVPEVRIEEPAGSNGTRPQ